jgi:molybdenum cofactor cytidylyltransferase
MPPVIFPRYCFTDLMSLKGDKGAKILLHKYKESLQEVLLPNAAIDIDTQKDLSNWHKNNHKFRL